MVFVKNKDHNHSANLTDGSFELNFDLEKPQYFTFKHGEESSTIYLEPGDDVKLTLDPKQFDESIRLSGKGAEESNYLFSKYLVDEKLWEDYQSVYKLGTSEFLQEVEGFYDKMKTNLDDYAVKNQGMNADFIKHEKASLLYDIAGNKMQYPNYHKYFAKKDAELGDDFYAFAKALDLNDETLLSNRTYTNFQRSYVSHLVEEKNER